MKYILSTAIRLLNSVHMERINEGCCERCGHKSRTYEQRPGWHTVQEGGKASLQYNQKYVAYAHEREADARHERTPSRLRRDQPDELEWILAYLMADDTDRFFDALRSDPEILLEKEIWDRTVMTWFNEKLGPDTQSRNKAQNLLKKVGAALAAVNSGNVEHITDDERAAIATSYEKWQPICEGLNTEIKRFKKAWKARTPTNSDREKFREWMAEKFKIDVADVQAIEWRLAKPSQEASKSTPTEAICHIVAREHGVGEQTVGETWRDHLKTHPDKRRRARKPTTTSSADERIA